MATKIKYEDLGNEINKMLTDYSSELISKSKEICKSVAKDTANELKGTSPKSKHLKQSGKYAKSWKATKIKDSAIEVNYSVHAGQYQLTHLLEFGHLIKNGTGRTFGFTKAQPHIGKAEKRAIEAFEKEIKEAI